MRVLYVVPADREFRDDYSDGISKAIVDVQSWYRRQLDGLTFDIYSVMPEQCHLPRSEDYYSHVLVQHCQQLQRTPVVRPRGHEVVRPDVAPIQRPQPDARSVVEPQPTPFRLPSGHF